MIKKVVKKFILIFNELIQAIIIILIFEIIMDCIKRKLEGGKNNDEHQ